MTADFERLPHVDEHSILVEAAPEPTWRAVLDVLDGSFASPLGSLGARLLGCADVVRRGPRPLAVGAAIPGFRVAEAEPPALLVLRGTHRFSDYALIARLREEGPGRTRLSAETRAEFPGMSGRGYRALVIGTHGHVVLTRRLLKAMRRRAERA